MSARPRFLLFSGRVTLFAFGVGPKPLVAVEYFQTSKSLHTFVTASAIRDTSFRRDFIASMNDLMTGRRSIRSFPSDKLLQQVSQNIKVSRRE